MQAILGFLIVLFFGLAGAYGLFSIQRDLKSGWTVHHGRGPKRTYFRSRAPGKYWFSLFGDLLGVGLVFTIAYTLFRVIFL